MFMNIYRDTAIVLCPSFLCFSINISILSIFSMFKGLSVSWWYVIIQIFFILFQTVKYETGNPWTIIQRALNNVGEGCLFSLHGKHSTILYNVQVTGYSGGNVQEGVFLQMVLLTEVLLDVSGFCFFFLLILHFFPRSWGTSLFITKTFKQGWV